MSIIEKLGTSLAEVICNGTRVRIPFDDTFTPVHSERGAAFVLDFRVKFEYDFGLNIESSRVLMLLSIRSRQEGLVLQGPYPSQIQLRKGQFVELYPRYKNVRDLKLFLPGKTAHLSFYTGSFAGNEFFNISAGRYG